MGSFAEKHMQKYGWKVGQGLGRNESGILEPIKVKMKVDQAGVGHDPSEQFTYHWWDHAFKNASANISVIEHENGVNVTSKDKSSAISCKKIKKRKLGDQKTLYGKFVKSGVVNNGVFEKDENGLSGEESYDELDNVNVITDEQLLEACGKRTAHKGARHGIKQSGKLARLAEHESGLLNNEIALKQSVPANFSSCCKKDTGSINTDILIKSSLKSNKDKVKKAKKKKMKKDKQLEKEIKF